MCWRCVILCACSCLLLPPGATRAQHASESNPATAMSLARFGRLKRGAEMRFRVDLSSEHQGSFLGSRGDTLLFQVGVQTVPVKFSDLDQLWVRRPATAHGARIRAFWGAVLGGAVFALGAVFTLGGCEYDCPQEDTQFVVGTAFTGLLVGVVGGAIVGGGIGSLFREWHLRYAAVGRS